MMLKHGTKAKAWWRGFKSGYLVVLFACFALLGVLVLVILGNVENAAALSGVSRKTPDDSGSRPSYPRVEFRNGTDLIWQVPDSPRAVLFLAHGCSGRAANFWEKSSHCPNCVGLPEESHIVLEAIARGYAVLAISSVGRCWTFEEEMVVVENLILCWVKDNNLENLPLVALGASSGGYFVSALATRLKFSSIVLMIAEGVFDRFDISREYPPTLFVHMPKDVFRKNKITEFVEVLKKKSIDVAEVECVELPLSPTFLAERIQGFDQELSAGLFELFREKGFIDSNGYMIQDGRATRWKEALRHRTNLQLQKNLFQHVQEELNLAFAYHEMTSLQLEQIFNWFASHIK